MKYLKIIDAVWRQEEAWEEAAEAGAQEEPRATKRSRAQPNSVVASSLVQIARYACVAHLPEMLLNLARPVCPAELLEAHLHSLT